MADAQLSDASPSLHATLDRSPHPMANPGYGKRTTPGQNSPTNEDFTHLPPREAAVAAYVDRLPEGADISVKTLAKHLPYGQCALRTALNNLHRSGHLRRGREHLSVDAGGSRWITRSWWSRAARDDAWWAEFTRGGVPETETDAEPERARPRRSRAYILLAALGRTAPVLSLSQAECAALAPLVEEWFVRGAGEEIVLNAVTSGLPAPVHHPAGLVRRRLVDKMPPEPVPTPTPPPPPVGDRPPLRMLECAKCRVPGRPEALPGGLCGPCQGTPEPPRSRTAPLSATEVRALAADIRAGIRDARNTVRTETARKTAASGTAAHL